jgi:hypothetical protein
MPTARTQLTLDVELDSEPITGTLAYAAGGTKPFTGWIQLVSLLQAAATTKATHHHQPTLLAVGARTEDGI